MKPRSPAHRIRKTIKWGGAVVTVLLVVVWIGSGWWTISWYGRGGLVVQLQAGMVWVRHQAPVPTQLMGYYMRPLRPLSGFTCDGPLPFHLGVQVGRSTIGPNPSLCEPLWPLLMLAGIMVWLVWRWDAATRLSALRPLCQSCNYDRTGLASGAKCPECGTEGTSA